MDYIICCFLLLGIVFTNPFGDAIRDNGNKRLQKRIEIVTYLLFFLLIYFYSRSFNSIVCFGVGYTFLRAGLHNFIYNFSKRPVLPWYYSGGTCGFDDFENLISQHGQRKGVILLGRIIYFLISPFFFYLAYQNF